MTVLVTGSSGWLGRFLCPLLRERGYDTLGLDVAPGADTNVLASVADRAALAPLFQDYKITAVIHAGALHKPDIARFPQQAFIDVNVTGTLNLLEEAAARPGTRFVFTSTTSLMISQKIREERGAEAVWLDEESGPLEPRNIYGVTKLAAEGLCRQHHLTRDLDVIILRTARFFPETDDTITDLSGPNLKSNELLYRRATVQDMARAHLCALECAGDIGFGLYIVAAPTPFSREDCGQLRSDAATLIADYFPEAKTLYAQNNWQLPQSIGRVYDGSRITRALGFQYQTGFDAVLSALRTGSDLPVLHNPAYCSPLAEMGTASAQL